MGDVENWDYLESLIDDALPTLRSLEGSDARIFETAVNLLQDLRCVRTEKDFYDVGSYVLRVLGHILYGENLAMIFHEATGDDSFMEKWHGTSVLHSELGRFLGPLSRIYED